MTSPQAEYNSLPSPTEAALSLAGPLLSVEQLEVGFPSAETNGKAGWLKALDKVSFAIYPGEILGLVGESGSGKSLTSLAILGLLPGRGRRLGGSISFQRQSITSMKEKQLRKLRGAQIALIPQDPLSALNPVYTIGEQLVEVLQTHLKLSGKEAKEKAIDLLDSVQIPRAAERFKQYPHEFSGGMRQRALIAMALSCSPKLLIADEPTTALDVTVQAQILALLEQLAKEQGMSVLFITHDLGVVAEICHRVAVMYAGQIVEAAPVEALFAEPRHPYTQGLLASLPKRTTDASPLYCIPGQPPSLKHRSPGCAFAPRCPHVMERCNIPVEEIKPTPIAANHSVRCYLYGQTNA